MQTTAVLDLVCMASSVAIHGIAAAICVFMQSIITAQLHRLLAGAGASTADRPPRAATPNTPAMPRMPSLNDIAAPLLPRQEHCSLALPQPEPAPPRQLCAAQLQPYSHIGSGSGEALPGLGRRQSARDGSAWQEAGDGGSGGATPRSAHLFNHPLDAMIDLAGAAQVRCRRLFASCWPPCVHACSFHTAHEHSCPITAPMRCLAKTGHGPHCKRAQTNMLESVCLQVPPISVAPSMSLEAIFTLMNSMALELVPIVAPGGVYHGVLTRACMMRFQRRLEH